MREMRLREMCSCVLYCMTFSSMTFLCIQVATELGDKIKVLKIDTDENPELSSQLQVMCCSETGG